jgi:glycosyltransferase involved in cell wall biosynthesis
MKILVFSLGPIFKDHVHGGSQKVLREVAISLGEKNNQVDIFCVRRDDNKEVFSLSKNVTVYPILKFKQTFPSSYKTSPFNLYQIIKVLKEEIDKHDVFYIHDAGLNLTFLCNQSIPTVISLRDFLYPETLLGAFNFRRDKIIVNSLHTLNSLKKTVGNYLPGIENRVEFVNNGINLEIFKRKTPNNIARLLESELNDEDLKIIYPHRPDPSKGIYQTLEIVRRLKFNKGLKNIKLLIPHYIDEEISNDLSSHYENIKKIAEKKGISENLVFHKWIPYELMPEYYSLGDLTLSIGNFIEAFGSNVGLESLSCDTPVIMSLVGAQRTTLPDNIIPKVPYDDLDSVEEIAYKILTKKQTFNFKEIREFISNNFSHKKMLSKYEEIICKCKMLPPLEFNFNQENKFASISPWCYLTEKGIYDDYCYGYHRISQELRNKFRDNQIDIDHSEMNESLRKEVERLKELGVLC